MCQLAYLLNGPELYKHIDCPLMCLYLAAGWFPGVFRAPQADSHQCQAEGEAGGTGNSGARSQD